MHTMHTPTEHELALPRVSAPTGLPIILRPLCTAVVAAFVVPLSGEDLPVARAQSHLPKQTNTVGMEFVTVPGGTFTMGSESGEADADERPLTRVSISSFSIGTSEVTRRQWLAVMPSDPSGPDSCTPDPDCPVVNVSWDDVQKFISAMRTKAGEELHTYRLPTEAEWEYAARAGTLGERYAGNLDEIAWHRGNSSGMPHPVKMKTPNAFDLYDMLGNAWEWVEDRYGRYPGTNLTDPTGPPTGTRRVLRGGGWFGDAAYSRAASRGYGNAADKLNNVGFRLVRADGEGSQDRAVVAVAVGSAGTVELARQNDGSYTLDGHAFRSGDVWTAPGGNRYELTLSGGTWTARYVPEAFTVVLGTSGQSVNLETVEEGGFRGNDQRVWTDNREPLVRTEYGLYWLSFDGNRWNARFVSETFTVVLGASGESMVLETVESRDVVFRAAPGSTGSIDFSSPDVLVLRASNGDPYVPEELYSAASSERPLLQGKRFLAVFLAQEVDVYEVITGAPVEFEVPIQTAERGGYSIAGHRIADDQWGRMTLVALDGFVYRIELNADGKPVAVFVDSRFTNSVGMGLLRIEAPRPFYIGAWEVTQGEWEQVMGDNPSHFRDCGRDCPVESVSFHDVQEFLNKLNSIEGLPAPLQYRLPTEQEWRYVPSRRGGIERPRNPWCKENSNDRTHPVQPDRPFFTLHNMNGNVKEWTASQGGTSRGQVVLGGSWQHQERHSNSFYRCWYGARQEILKDARLKNLGFRVLLEAPEPVYEDPADDHGNDLTSATSVGVVSVTHGSIGPSGDIDVFRFETAAPLEITISTRGMSTAGSLLDASGKLLVDDSYPNLYISTRILPGEHYIRVASGDLSSTGEYELLVKGLSIATGNTFRECDDCPELVTIPGGIFRMGSPLTEYRRGDREGPMSYVQIGNGDPERSALAIGKFEVTRLQYQACVDAGRCESPQASSPPSDPRLDRHMPVEGVSWRDANAYCEWLSWRTSKRYRLPTEAEWEYAARAGTQTAYFWGDRINHRFAKYDDWDVRELYRPPRTKPPSQQSLSYRLEERWGGRLSDQALSDLLAALRSDDKAAAFGLVKRPSRIGLYPPNAFGLYDMHGNVWEWTATCASPTLDYRYFSDDGSPGSIDCGNRSASRVTRGGGYNWTARDARAARRGFDGPGEREHGVGFRVVRELLLEP